jgi:hypothetical protein
VPLGKRLPLLAESYRAFLASPSRVTAGAVARETLAHLPNRDGSRFTPTSACAGQDLQARMPRSSLSRTCPWVQFPAFTAGHKRTISPQITAANRPGRMRASAAPDTKRTVAKAFIGLAVPDRPIGPWSRRTGAPKASATRQDRKLHSVRAGSAADRRTADNSGQERSLNVPRNPQVAPPIGS